MTGWLVRRLVAAALIWGLAFSLGRAGGEEKSGTPVIVTHKAEGWAVAAPADWRSLPRLCRPPMVLYLTGDGRGGLPRVDGTLSPLQAGLAVEIMDEETGTPKELLASLVHELETSVQFRLRDKAITKDTVLKDGTPAMVLSAEFDRLDTGRLSFYRKVVCADKDGRLIVAGAWLICGKASSRFAKKSGLLALVQSCADSLVLHADKMDHNPLKKAGSAVAPGISSAIAKVTVGNRLMGQDDRKAVRLFGEALQLCEFISSAHNNLAWILLTSRDKRVLDTSQGLKHAEQAVAFTERLEARSLDTLAVGYHKTGQADKALQAVQEAVELDPTDQDLLKKMKLYEAAATNARPEAE